MIYILIILVFMAKAEAGNPAGPMAVLAVGSECGRVAEDALVPLGILTAVLASEQELGRIPPEKLRHQNAALESFRSAAVICRQREEDLEMISMQPGGNVAAAKAELESKLQLLQQSISAAMEGAISSDQDRRIDASLDPTLRNLIHRWRSSEKYMGDSERFRVAVRNALQSALAASIDCRIQAKMGRDHGPCLDGLYGVFGRAQEKISAAADRYRPQYASFRVTHDGLQAQKQSRVSLIMSLQQKGWQLASLIKKMEEDLGYLKSALAYARGVVSQHLASLPGLKEQARKFDSLRASYLQLGWSHHNLYSTYLSYGASHWGSYLQSSALLRLFWVSGNYWSGLQYAALVSYHLGAYGWYAWAAEHNRQLAYSHWASYGAYDHAFRALTGSIIPNVEAIAGSHRKWAEAIEMEISAQEGRMGKADVDSAAIKQEVNQAEALLRESEMNIQQVRQRIVSTCMDTTELTFPGAPHCASLTGTEL